MILEIPFAFIVEWIDRKITAKVQRRVGPKYTGIFGILQPIADFLKLIQKKGKPLGYREEFLIPIFLVSSLIVLIILFLFLPFPFSVFSFKGDIILILFLYSLVASFFIIVGYLIPSPYSNLGAARYLQMFASFELLFIFSISSVVIFKDSITLMEISKQEFPMLIVLPISFVCYLLSSAAKLNFKPFDISNAPTEIAEGWECELYGRNLAIAKLCYDLEFLFLASFGTILFFGYKNFFLFLCETFLVIVLLSLFKNAAARLRVDQAILLFWREAIPLSLLQILIVVMMVWFG